MHFQDEMVNVFPPKGSVQWKFAMSATIIIVIHNTILNTITFIQVFKNLIFLFIQFDKT